jgi:hypothetical protein
LKWLELFFLDRHCLNSLLLRIQALGSIMKKHFSEACYVLAACQTTHRISFLRNHRGSQKMMLKPQRLIYIR